MEDEIERTQGDFEIELKKLIMKHSGTQINGFKPDPALVKDAVLVKYIHDCLTNFEKGYKNK